MSDELLNPNARQWRHDHQANYEHHGFLAAVCTALDLPASWQDDQGYHHEITAAAVHPSEEHLAWVECRQKWLVRNGQNWLDIDYRLKVRISGRLAIDWEIDPYKPFFGFKVGYLAWHGNHVVMVYREKHDTYACSLKEEERPRLVRVATRWVVAGRVIAFCPWESDRVERLSLPSLEPIAPLTGAAALATGLLGDD
jgi:hypothetical protein